MSAVPFRRRRGDRALPEEPRFAPEATPPAVPFEYSPPMEWVCGCNVKRIGPCPTCSAQYQREQREARR